MGAGALAGGAIAASGAKSAANAQAKSADAAVAEQQRQFDLTRADTAPYRAIGGQALNALGSIYGYSPTTTGSSPSAPAEKPLTFEQFLAKNGGYQLALGGGPAHLMPNIGGAQADYQAYLKNFAPPTPAASPNTLTAPDYSNFFASPDYNFRKQQGMQGIENSASAAGGVRSGNALKALADFNSNLAAGEFGNYFNRQATLAGIGQTANAQSASAGSAAAANIGNALLAGGNARASGIAGQTDAWGNALNGIGTAIGVWQAGRKPPNGSSYSFRGFG